METIAPEFWRLIATISATIIGLVFLGTFYYLESGWKNFRLVQTEMESISINYAKIIIVYFSTALFLSLVQQTFLPELLPIIVYLFLIIAAVLTTKSLNDSLRNLQRVFSEIDNNFQKWTRRFLWIYLFVIFFVPVVVIHWGPTFSVNSITNPYISERSLAWTVLLSLAFGYWNLVQFLFTPYRVHKMERDESARQNKLDVSQGELPSQPTWDEERIRHAEERIESALDEKGYTSLPEVEIEDTYMQYEELSGEMTKPRLHGVPQVSEYGEAMIHVILPDDWSSDEDLLTQSSIVARNLVSISKNAYPDLTGVDVRVWRRHILPWEDSRSRDMILRARWEGPDLNELGGSDPEKILESATDVLIDKCLFPVGFANHDFNPSEKEPSQEEEYRVYDVDDVSNAKAKRYRSRIVVHEDLTKENLIELMPDIVDEIRGLELYRNEKTEQMWSGTPAQAVWIYAFNESRIPAEMMAIDDYSHYVCQAEWFDSDLGPDHAPRKMKNPDEEIDDIRIKWSNQ